MTDTTLLRLPDLPETVRGLTNDEAKILDQRYPVSKERPGGCVTCNGTRRFVYFVGDGDETAEYECDCRDQYRLSRWLWHNGILKRWQRLAWRDFDRLDGTTATQALGYIEHLPQYLAGGIGLVLSGPRGTGKTLLAHLLLKEALRRYGVNCYATSFSQMIDEFAKGWPKTTEGQQQARWFESRVRDAGLLFIDDLGRERNKGAGSVGDNMLETIIRHRVGCQLPTIITTNIEHADLGTAYGGHTESLLTESALRITVPGTDSRQDMQTREVDLITRGITRPVIL